jgi:threonine dehydrogenase-like Zn-dependent dehydrogenase
MFGAVIHAPGDVRYQERPEPTIIEPTDAVIRVTAACVCGSDLWRYRGISPVPEPTPIGHEYCGVVEEVGSAVTTVKPGDFVVGGFNPCDNTCAACRKGATANCLNAAHYSGCQADKLRVPLADGTLVAIPGMPADDRRQHRPRRCTSRRSANRPVLLEERRRQGRPGELPRVPAAPDLHKRK